MAVKSKLALVTSLTAPYHRAIRILDGVPVTDTSFPAQASPIGLAASATSPSGKYIMCAGAASSTQPFRLWRSDDGGKTYKAKAIPAALPIALTITNILFLNDEAVVVGDPTYTGGVGLYWGIIDQTTDAIAWTAFPTTGTTPNKITEIIKLTELDIICLRNNSGTRVLMAYTYDPATKTFALANIGGLTTAGTGDKGTAIFNDIGADMIWGANTFASPGGRQIDTVNRASASNTASTFVITDAALMTSLGTSTIWADFESSPDGRYTPFSHNEAPYLRMLIRTGDKTVAAGARKYMLQRPLPVFDPLFTAPMNDIKFIGNEKFLVAANSNVQGAGRVRAFSIDKDFNFQEDKAFSALFNDWSAIPTSITVGPEISIASIANVYDSAVAAIANRTANFGNLKIALLSSWASFNPANTTLAQALGANEVYGSSWPQGGIACNAATFVGLGTDEAGLSITVPALDLLAAGSITFHYAVIYDNADANKRPLLFLDFGEEITATQPDRVQLSAPGGIAVIFGAAA